ncbi:MAG: hypothetical protein Q8P46_00335 [Hyphomicrobiales bacterium]|nr:hypothetical protein [Hyphomicrobiales bacterium]
MRRPGTKLIHTFDDDEQGVSMVQHEGRIFVATSKRVYVVIDDKLVPLKIETVA